MKLVNTVVARVPSCAGGPRVVGGAWAASGSGAPTQPRQAPSATAPHEDRTSELNDGTPPGVEGTGEWIDVAEPASVTPAP